MNWRARQRAEKEAVPVTPEPAAVNLPRVEPAVASPEAEIAFGPVMDDAIDGCGGVYTHPD